MLSTAFKEVEVEAELGKLEMGLVASIELLGLVYLTCFTLLAIFHSKLFS